MDWFIRIGSFVIAFAAIYGGSALLNKVYRGIDNISDKRSDNKANKAAGSQSGSLVDAYRSEDNK